VDEVGGFGCLGARGQWGLLSGLGRVVALGHLKACGLRPGDGPDMIGPVKLDRGLFFTVWPSMDVRGVKATRDDLERATVDQPDIRGLGTA